MLVFKYVVKRFVSMLLMLFLISIGTFIIIELPPGDHVSGIIAQMISEGEVVDDELIAALRRQYGLDRPAHERYFRWISSIVLRGDFGHSLLWRSPVTQVMGDRMLITVILSVATLIFTYITAISAGLYSAVRQYSALDYLFTVLAFIAVSIPNFLLTLLVLFGVFSATGVSMTGLFSPEFVDAPWSFARFMNMLQHFPIPIIVTAVGGIAGTYRITRGCMLDELDKTYVTAARARGLPESRLLFKYPARIALNPIFSSIGFILPGLISAGTIVAIVLSLPTVGPLLIEALRSQDMYLAGAIVLLLSFLTILGMFLSDILLMFVDPRIKLKD
jgi:peptide/nickel transport system permease protein